MNTFRSRIGFGLLILLSAGIGVFALMQYVVLRQPADVLMSTFLEQPFWLYLHILASVIALITGPWQFSSRLRRRNPALHRWMGRVYLALGVIPGALAGLVIAPNSEANLTGRIGIMLLAILWLWTSYHAYRTIRAGRVQEHKGWMIRNYALTFAAVTLRLYLPVGITLLMPGLETVYNGSFDALFLDVYSTVFWLSWVPNLIVAERIIERQRRRSSVSEMRTQPRQARALEAVSGD